MNASVIPNPCRYSACNTRTCSDWQPSFSGTRLVLYGAADVAAGAAFGATIAAAHSQLVLHGSPGFVTSVLSLALVMLFQMLLCFALWAIIVPE